jgi:predicted TIM-barrel fold metal-dependent hydrolase
MIIDFHTHLVAQGWVPNKIFHGIARFITHESAKQGIHQSNEEVGDSLIKSINDPNARILLETMDEAGIDKSIICPLDFGLAVGDPEISIEEVNKQFANLAQKHPDRLIAFTCVDPRRKGALELFSRCVEEWDMKGLKLLPCCGFYPNQEEVYPLLEKANELKLPVLFHSGPVWVPLWSKYCQPIYFDDLAVDFPDLSIIAAHACGVLGYPQLLSVMSLKLNIMADISSWQVFAEKDYLSFAKALRMMIDSTEPERILFGSDSPSFWSIMSNKEWVQLVN